MARYRRRTPQDDYEGQPIRTHTELLDKGVALTTRQWPSYAFEFVVEMPSDRTDFDDLTANGWSPTKDGPTIKVIRRYEMIESGQALADTMIKFFVK